MISLVITHKETPPNGDHSLVTRKVCIGDNGPVPVERLVSTITDRHIEAGVLEQILTTIKKSWENPVDLFPAFYPVEYNFTIR